MSVFLCVWIPTFLLNEVSDLWLYWRSLHFSARSPVLSRNSSLFYFIFFHFSRHKTHLPHLLHPTFYPLQHHRLALLLLTHLCVCVCVHESNSTTLPLLPGLIIVLRRALPFSIWYPWQHILPWRAVCLRWSFSPTHSSLFPFPLHYSLRNRLPRFFSAFSLHFLHRPCYPKHVTLLRSLYISLRTPYFLCIFSADLLLCDLSLQYMQPRPLLHVSNEKPLHIYLMAFNCWGLLSFLELTHSSVCVTVCLFSPAELC